MLMVQGNTIKQVASKLDLTENTARWYSKQIMSKVGVKRQAELSTLMMKDIAFMLNIEASQPTS